MVFLHAALLEHLMFRCAPCLLCTEQLQQAGVRRTCQKVRFTCPALAAGLDCLLCACTPVTWLPSPFPFTPLLSSLVLLTAQELQPLPPFPSGSTGPEEQWFTGRGPEDQGSRREGTALPGRAPLNVFLRAGRDDKRGHQLHACRGVPGKAKRWQSMSQWWMMLRPALRRG